jgi:oligopeptide/dipeptide ABC transporter ATP-binding protein
MQASDALLSVDRVRVEIDSLRGTVVPSDDVSYSIAHGEIVGLVGESGCGKTMTALANLRLLPRGARIASGRITLGDVDLTSSDEAALQQVRGGRIGYVAQDATMALDPVQRISTQISEGLQAQLGLSRDEARKRALSLVRSVGIPEAETRLEAYPHELSGGMRQRVAIAIALSCEPELIIADEPTTALDVTVQAEIIDLLVSAAQRRHMAVLLISHDLGLVSRVTDRTLVMYAGRIVESGPTPQILEAPEHPYTEALLASTPRVRTDRVARFPVIPGRPPDLVAPPPGCRFAARCRYTQARCLDDEPRLGELPVACWYPRSAGHQQSRSREPANA